MLLAVACVVLVIGFAQRHVAFTAGQWMSQQSWQYIRGRGADESVQRVYAEDRLRLLSFAKEQGILDDPVVQFAMQDVAILALKRAYMAADPGEPAPAALQAFYSDRAESYRSSEERRIAVVQLRPEDQGEFEQALQAFSAGQAYQGFAALSARFSQHRRTRLYGGDLDWLSQDQALSLPQALWSAIWSDGIELWQPQALVVGDDIWWWMMTDFRAAAVPELATIKGKVLRDYLQDAQRQQEAAFEALWKKKKVWWLSDMLGE